MNVDGFLEIMDDEDSGSRLFEKGCNALTGLLIIQKYLPNRGIEAAGHDIIYSAEVEELVEAGITEEDTVLLRDYNWMVDEESLACFV